MTRRSDLTAAVMAALPENTVGAISPSDVRDRFLDILNTVVLNDDLGTAATKDVAPTAEAQSGTGTNLLTSSGGKSLLDALLGSIKVAATKADVAEPSVATAFSDLLSQTIRPEQMGVDATGLQDAGPLLSKVLKKAMVSGRPARIDKGRYLLKTAVVLTVIASLEVHCHPEAVFVADSALNTKMIFLTNPVSGNNPVGSVKWFGGEFDSTALAVSPPGLAYDSLTISENFEDVLIERAKFIHSRGNVASQGLGKALVTGGGSGYTTATVTIGAPDQPGGRQATGIVGITGGAVSGFTFTDSGRGYSTVPAITVTGDGTGATVSVGLVSDYRTGGGDSSILVAGKRITVRGCHFQGSPDCGVYPTALANGTFGESLTITGNTFVRVNNPVVAKRAFKRYIAAHNHVYLCRTGFSTGIADVTLPAGAQQVVTSNIFKMVQSNLVQIMLSDGSICSNNLIEDFGSNIDGTPQFGSVGIFITGSSKCTFGGNTVRMVDWITASNHAAFKLSPFVQNGVTTQSLNNSFAANNISNVALGFVETDAACDNNHYGPNKFVSVTTDYALLGTNATVIRAGNGQISVQAGSFVFKGISSTGADTAPVLNFLGTGSNVISVPAGAPLILGGNAGSEVLRLSRGATSQNQFEMVSTATGINPRFAPRGADANLSVEIQGKGTGGVTLKDGASAFKVQVNTTGIGFFAASPVAKQSVAAAATDAATTQALVNSLRAALIAYGLAA